MRGSICRSPYDPSYFERANSFSALSYFMIIAIDTVVNQRDCARFGQQPSSNFHSAAERD